MHPPLSQNTLESPLPITCICTGGEKKVVCIVMKKRSQNPPNIPWPLQKHCMRLKKLPPKEKKLLYAVSLKLSVYILASIRMQNPNLHPILKIGSASVCQPSTG